MEFGILRITAPEVGTVFEVDLRNNNVTVPWTAPQFYELINVKLGRLASDVTVEVTV